MRISAVKNLLIGLYMANKERTTVLLLGAPGVGKSLGVLEATQELASRLNKEFVVYDDAIARKLLETPDKYFVFLDLRLTECEPSDLTGVPRSSDGATEYVPLLWAKVMQVCAGLILLDELTNVQRPDVQAASYKITLDRRAGFTSFNKDVMVVAAGNTPETSAIANMLPAPLINRMAVIQVDPATVDSWASWMEDTYGDEWDKSAYAFLKRFEAEGYLLQPPKEPETLMNYPTPRSWTKVARLLKLSGTNPVVVEGLIGPEVATKYEAFRKVKVDIDELIKRPEDFGQMEIDAQYMACMMLGSWLTQHQANIAKAAPLVDAVKNESNEYLVFTLMTVGAQRRANVITQLITMRPALRSVLEDLVVVKRHQL